MTALDPVRLDICNLRFSHPGRVLWTGLNARIGPGVTLEHGDDGSGKTTLLRLLAGALPLQGGQLRLSGSDVAAAIDSALHPEAWGEQVFWVDPQAEMAESVPALPARAWLQSLAGRWPRLNVKLLADLTAGLQLDAHLDKAFYMLSTGTRRKVWLAGALASGAAVTLLDQPFAALDRASIQLLLEVLQDAATHPTRAWVLADGVTPPGVALAGLIGALPENGESHTPGGLSRS